MRELKDIELTKQIHLLTRDKLTWGQSLLLLDDIAEKPEWIAFLETDLHLYQMAQIQ